MRQRNLDVKTIVLSFYTKKDSQTETPKYNRSQPVQNGLELALQKQIFILVQV